MPRTRKSKPIDYDSAIKDLDDQITQCNKTKAELTKQRQNILNAKRESELGVLYDTLQKHGVTAEEIIRLLERETRDQA